MQAEKKRSIILTLFFVSVCIGTQQLSYAVSDTDEEDIMHDAYAEVEQERAEQRSMPQQVPRRINEIVVVGNTFTPTGAILNYIPYHVGEIFDPQKSGVLIRNLYEKLKRFRNITLKGAYVDDDLIDLYVIVEEKTPLKDVTFVGNKNLAEKEIFKKIDMDIAALDAEQLKLFAQQIKKLYYDKGFQNVEIATELTIDEDGRAIAIFTMDEGKKSRIRRISFEGNSYFNTKDLRNVLFTREEWILSILDKTGTFHPERLQADKHVLEQFYQNHGFMQAKVIDVRIEKEGAPKKESAEHTPKYPRRRARKKQEEASDNNILNLTFVIDEGERYTIGDVKAPGVQDVSEEFLLANIPIRSGQYYSRERIANTIKMMEFLWGNRGYIFAHIEPSIKVDQEAKKVDITLTSDIGKQIKLNKITIRGNRKTRDKVIRRRISLQEGGVLTQGQMEASKNSVMNLGYFEKQDGVNWKIKRKNDEEADLDLMIREAKTGHANIQLGFGGTGLESINALASGVNVKGSIADTNLFGTGMVVNLEASWAKDEQTLNFHLAQPWLFDKPISGAMDIYHRRPSYDQLRNVMSAINSKITGAALTGGVITPAVWPILNNAQFLTRLGGESVQYLNVPRVNIVGSAVLSKGVTREQAAIEYAEILSKEFTPGEYMWLQWNVEQDKRNHPVHASRGHKWQLISKVAVPSFERKFSDVDGSKKRRHNSYAKLYFDYTWYTPLINELDLVFKLHLFVGLATPIKDHSIPFGELFHIGGDTTVRGFSYGEIGPKFLGDTIGGKKAFFMNTELIFPITSDLSMKGVIFYDGGAGWDNPYAGCTTPGLVTNNSFDYRHAVGFGLRLLRPMPVRVDWGFKLDPRTGERESQVHFGMTYDW